MKNHKYLYYKLIFSILLLVFGLFTTKGQITATADEVCTAGSAITGTSPNGAVPKALKGNCTNYDISRVAGLGDSNEGSQDGPALQSSFSFPAGLDVDAQGNIYVADGNNHIIRKITTQGVVSTLAGKTGVKGYRDGVGNDALFNRPRDVSVDLTGNVYVTDASNNVIRKITPSGMVSTYAGGGRGDGVGTEAGFNLPFGIDIDVQGNLYVAGINKVRKIDTQQRVTTLATFPTMSELYFLSDLVIAPSGIIYVANNNGHTIHQIGVDGTTSLLAGQLGVKGEEDGVGSAATIEIPAGLEIDNCGDLYVGQGLKIRKITPEGVVTTLGEFFRNGVSVFYGITIDRAGNFLVSDWYLNSIYRIGNCTIDGDNDGYIESLDCDDNNVSINPGAIEVANTGFDENCDGISLIIDNDNDGYNSSIDCDDNNANINAGATEIPNNGIDEDCNGSDLVQVTDNDNDGYAIEVDCNDNNPAINPGASEVANSGFDENCDGISLIIDNDNDGYNSSIDCDDNNASINAGATEIPDNGIDEDCNGSDLIAKVDNDDDGYTNDVDCNDSNAAINPGAAEIANSGFDENCDGISLIIDNDNDGFNSSIDCDDNNASINAGAAEIANNGVDEDCNGSDLVTVLDSDNDGYTNDVDCNDGNPAINPGAQEIANSGFDENCDGISLIIDNDNDGYNSSIDCDDNNAGINAGAAEIANNGIDENCDGVDLVTVMDNDNDGFTNDVDCNDGNAAINPGAVEIANSGFDENCDGISLIIDNDNDGYNSSIDCDDNNPNINGRAEEIPNNGIDENCDGEDLTQVIDEDGDGFTTVVDCNDNDPNINPLAVEIPNNQIDEDCDGIALFIDEDQDGYHTDIDCDDTNPTVHNDAIEIPNNGIDEDCDGEDLIEVIDNDGDGFTTVLDCNDDDPNINPLAEEIPGNGIDENCDGEFTTSTFEEEFAKTFKLFPNPSNGTLYLADNEYVERTFKIEIKDYLGKTLSQQWMHKNEIMPIDISQMNTGLLLISIHTEYGVLNNRVVLVR